jgi:hypothetical protein
MQQRKTMSKVRANIPNLALVFLFIYFFLFLFQKGSRSYQLYIPSAEFVGPQQQGDYMNRSDSDLSSYFLVLNTGEMKFLFLVAVLAMAVTLIKGYTDEEQWRDFKVGPN